MALGWQTFAKRVYGKAWFGAQDLPVIHAQAASIDISSRFHITAVSGDLSESPVRTFNASTAQYLVVKPQFW